MSLPRAPKLLAWIVVLALVVPALALVAGGQLPERPTKEKVFYLQTSDEARNIGVITTQTFMDTNVGTNGQVIDSDHQVVARWFVFPELAGPVHVNGTVRIQVWWRAQGMAETGNVDWTLTLREIAANGTVAEIGSQDVSVQASNVFAVGEGRVDGVDYILSAGATLEAHLRLFGNIATTYFLAWGNATFDSRLVLPTNDYVRPVPQGEGGIWTLDSEGNVENNFDPDAANKTVAIRALVTDPFGGYDVAAVNVTVFAPNGTVVPELDDAPMTKVLGFFNTFESVYEATWNYSGYADGRYNITITALDNTGRIAFETAGNVGGHLETADDGVFFIGALPIDVNILVRDGDGNALANAAVSLLLGDTVETSGLTNGSGMVAFNVSPGVYQVQVSWDETLVGNAPLDALDDVPFSDPLVLDVAVYSVSFRVLDTHGVALQDAAVGITFPNGRTTAEPLLTDAAGTVNVGLVAGGTFLLNVQWRGKAVADTAVGVVASGVYTVVGAVYYVTFTALDAQGAPVAGVLLTVADLAFGVVVEAQLTDGRGVLVSRIPVGTFAVEAEWFGVAVLGNATLTVDGDANVTLNLAVYPVTVVPVDSRGVPLEGATVSLASDVFALTDNAGLDGAVTFRVPAMDYEVVVRWMDTEVFRGSLAVDGTTTTVRVEADVYYLRVFALDREENRLGGVFVTATQDGETVAAGRTDANGTVEFRLPRGTYVVTGEVRTTYLLSPVEQTAETDVVLQEESDVVLAFLDFPPSPFGTALFFLLLGVLLLLAVIAYILLRWKGVIK
jgi:hypothetical protein